MKERAARRVDPMRRHVMTRLGSILVLLLFATGTPGVFAQGVIIIGPDKTEATKVDEGVTQGALRVETEDGKIVECPLKHTDVGARISGFIARVKVVQTFENPFDERIEAVYVFPLPHTAAVDDMTMVIGDRRIVGMIKRRDAARRIYEQALAAGKTASLLEQERPNIFTQSVGNIDPGQEIKIEISYVDVLAYDMGVYEFHFPMVVGPRYIPGSPTSDRPPVAEELEGAVGEIPEVPSTGGDPSGTGWAPDTDRVPDASRITPPVLKPGYRTGHDISLFVTLDAGVPVQGIEVPSHESEIREYGDSRADIRLSPEDSIPNKDFVLEYEVVGEKPQLAVLGHAPRPGEGYFMLMMQPKVDEALKEAPPREICFLIDVSGSMGGQPTEKVKAEMAELLKLVKPADRLQVITFAGSTNRLFPGYLPANQENIQKALSFTQAQRGSGGTEMLKGIREVIADPIDPERVRMVVMLTDGFIGNEAEIIKEVGENCGDMIRFWVIGIGNSVNRMLVDGVAKQGGGMGKVLELNEDPAPLAGELMERIHRAQLAKIEIDWGSLPVYETYPAKIPELWAGRPVIIHGRYEAGGESWVKVKGLVEGKPAEFPLYVRLPDNEPEQEVLAKVWARKKIADLMVQNYMGDPAVEGEITDIALRYRLMSQYTSFVAVDESDPDALAGPVSPPRRVPVAVPLPAGTSFEGFFGGAKEAELLADDVSSAYLSRARSAAPSRAFYARGSRAPSAVPEAGEMWFGASAETRDTLQALGYFGGGAKVGSLAKSMSLGAGLGGVRAPASRRGGRLMAGSRESWGDWSMWSMEGAVVAEVLDSSVNGIAYGLDVDSLSGLSVGDEEGRRKISEYQQAAQARIQAASGAETAAELEKAREELRLAIVLASANPWGDPGFEAGIVTRLELLRESLIDQQVEEHPELGTKLDIVLRHEALEAALKEIGKAAGIGIALIPGSGEDIRDLLLIPDLTIVYRDLRGANVAQALTWITAPFNLDWRVKEDGSVAVGPARRLEGDSVWVYPVGDLVIPTEEEFGDEEEDPAKQQEKVTRLLKESIDAFEAVANIFGASDEGFGPGTVELITPGELLVHGDANLHERIERALSGLKATDAKLGFVETEGEAEKFEKLHAMTWPRWEARRELRENRMKRAALMRVAGLLADGSWRLLAAAAKGETDPEALAELEAAWGSDEIDTLFEKGPNVLAYRSLFAITETARISPDDKDLQNLAAEAAMKGLAGFELPGEESPRPDHIAAVIYMVLADRDARELEVQDLPGEEVVGKSMEWIEAHKDRMGNELPFWFFVSGFRSEDLEKLAKTIRTNRAAGGDLFVLEALSARRMSGPVWEAFRREMPDLVRSQRLDGDAVVLINRLAGTDLPVVKG
jgi:Ca-activated chloride channel family protein